jgi:protein O-mannosyl-transferase
MPERSRLREWLTCLLLVVAIIVVFGQVWTFTFLGWDDIPYVREHPVISKGLASDSVIEALTSRSQGTHYMPLTTLSHMLDVQLFGFHAGWHHIVSLFLHAVNTLLLFEIWRRMTGKIWPSAFVAALFALHPLHVETVVWISDRKDLLCTSFGFLAIYAYVQYAMRREVEWYVLMIAAFLCSLLSKSMFVTLPCVLLLLDYWPLRRIKPINSRASVHDSQTKPTEERQFPQKGWKGLILEKAPLFLLAGVFVGVMFAADNTPGPRLTPEIPLGYRLSNALVSYIRYVAKTFCPTALSAWYVHPNLPGGRPWSNGEVIGAGLVLLIISGLSLRWRRYSYVIVGWLWFLGTLIPVLGWASSTRVAIADRYTYVSLIGLFVAVAWTLQEGATVFGRRRFHLGSLRVAVAVAAIASCMLLSWHQARHWRESIQFFEHELAAYPSNSLFHHNLGVVFELAGDHEQAIDHLEESLRISPNQLKPRYVLQEIYSAQGNRKEVFRQMTEQTKIREKLVYQTAHAPERDNRKQRQ